MSKLTTKKLIVLDVNGVLCYKISKHKDNIKNRTNILELSYNNVYFRPGAKKFLEWLFERYKVAIYSSTTFKNIKPILNYLMPKLYKKLVFLWCRDRCTLDPDYGTDTQIFKYSTIKLLSSILENPNINERRIYKKNNVLFLDDSPSKMRFNPVNSYYILKSYHPDDMELYSDVKIKIDEFEIIKLIIEINFVGIQKNKI